MREEATGSRVAIIAREVASTQAFLSALGVRELPALTSPFDPGYAPSEIESHLAQSGHLMATLKLSMACWQIANEAASRAKIAAAHAAGVEVTTGGGPFEVAVARGLLDEYLELCADMGFDRIECGEGFTTLRDDPRRSSRAHARRGSARAVRARPEARRPDHDETIEELVAVGSRWLDAGAVQLVVEARESAADVGLFDGAGSALRRSSPRCSSTGSGSTRSPSRRRTRRASSRS